MRIFALALLPLALACGPGGGLGSAGSAVTAKPTMKFTYSPPLAWTWNDKKASGGQSLTHTQAQNRINSDIEYAVIKAVEAYGFSTTGVMVENAVKPDGPMLLLDAGKPCPVSVAPPTTPTTPTTPTPTPPPATANDVSYVTDGEAVIKECLADGSDKVFEHKDVTITITSPVAISMNSWDNIASKVWATLTSSAGVKFHGMINITL